MFTIGIVIITILINGLMIGLILNLFITCITVSFILIPPFLLLYIIFILSITYKKHNKKDPFF